MSFWEKLVGEIITIEWPDDEEMYAALVVGFMPGEVRHKVFYFESETTEVLDLTKRRWHRGSRGTGQVHIRWGPMYKRIVVMKPDEEEGKVPYEAFVVKFFSDSRTYRVLYTQDDSLEDLILDHGDEDDWDIHPGGFMYRGLWIHSWLAFDE